MALQTLAQSVKIIAPRIFDADNQWCQSDSLFISSLGQVDLNAVVFRWVKLPNAIPVCVYYIDLFSRTIANPKTWTYISSFSSIPMPISHFFWDKTIGGLGTPFTTSAYGWFIKYCTPLVKQWYRSTGSLVFQLEAYSNSRSLEEVRAELLNTLPT